MEKSVQENRPQVGIGVMILKEGKVLLAKRKGSLGNGEYAFPGGHLEYMESFEDCARRETREECGIEIENIRFHLIENVKIYAPRHYVHIGMLAQWESGEPEVREPEKSEKWGWYDLKHLPRPLFNLSKMSIDRYKKEMRHV